MSNYDYEEEYQRTRAREHAAREAYKRARIAAQRPPRQVYTHERDALLYQQIPWDNLNTISVQPEERKPNMKIRNAAIMLDESITTIRAKWSSSSAYTFICTKELALTLKKDDHVVVSKNDGSISVVEVLEVHEETDIDMDSGFTYNWAIQRVDVDALKTLNEALDAQVAQLKTMQRSALRAQIKQQVEQGKLIDLSKDE